MDYDVIVGGGGTAGSVAAIAAARHGAKTLIVEQFGFLGGSQTGALVIPMMAFYAGDERLVTGISDEIIGRCSALPGDNEGIFFNPELLKFVLEDMVLEAGCELLYHTFISDTAVEDGALTGIEIVNKSGKQVLRARQFIESDGLNQSASLRFTVGGVDLEALAEFLREHGVNTRPPRVSCGFAKGGVGHAPLGEIMEQAERDGVIGAEEGAYIQFFSIPGRPGELGFNCPRVTHVNGAKAEDLVKVQVQGRKSIPRKRREGRGPGQGAGAGPQEHPANHGVLPPVLGGL